ncbi:hypothetical protein CGRA01v4_10285 [Colletotrichum graminicola]|nr:hypothetical protein CGRA01v4_10285 [Colletotrichum graminicola]
MAKRVCCFPLQVKIWSFLTIPRYTFWHTAAKCKVREPLVVSLHTSSKLLSWSG